MGCHCNSDTLIAHGPGRTLFALYIKSNSEDDFCVNGHVGIIKYSWNLIVENKSSFNFHFHALEKDMAPHSSVLAWRIPGTVEPGGLPSMGSHRDGHD